MAVIVFVVLSRRARGLQREQMYTEIRLLFDYQITNGLVEQPLRDSSAPASAAHPASAATGDHPGFDQSVEGTPPAICKNFTT